MSRNNRLKLLFSKDTFTNFSMLWLIVVSGSEYFMNQNMPFSTMIMFALSFILCIFNPRIKKKVINVLVLIGTYMLLSTFFNFQNGIYINDIIIDIVKIIFVVSIASNISLDDFLKKYVYIMTILALLSLLCHFYIQITNGGPLPLQQTFYNANGLRRYSAFYHTVGWELSNGMYYYSKGYGYFTRNAGIFWEPGAFQLFLNLAILFYCARQESFQSISNSRMNKWILPILGVTVLTTQSTTGYICLILNIIFYIFYHDKVKKMKTKMLVFAAGGIGIGVIEMFTGVIGDKLLGHEASYYTRLFDTVNGFDVVLENPFLGLGFFPKEYINNILLSKGINNISNGLVAFAINAGMIGLIYYLFKIWIFLKRICFRNYICMTIAFLMIIVISNSESVFFAPLFLIMLFPLDPKIHENI